VPLLENERTGVDVFQDVDIHDWEFGGRRPTADEFGSVWRS
jgi:hypothetical protein